MGRRSRTKVAKKGDLPGLPPENSGEIPAAPVKKLPEMAPCPGCGLVLQLGDDENGRAYHDCERVRSMSAPATLEGIEQVLMRRMLFLAESATARDAVALHREIQALKRPLPEKPDEESGDKPKKKRAGRSGRLLNWVAGPARDRES